MCDASGMTRLRERHLGRVTATGSEECRIFSDTEKKKHGRDVFYSWNDKDIESRFQVGDFVVFCVGPGEFADDAGLVAVDVHRVVAPSEQAADGASETDHVEDEASEEPRRRSIGKGTGNTSCEEGIDQLREDVPESRVARSALPRMRQDLSQRQMKNVLNQIPTKDSGCAGCYPG